MGRKQLLIFAILLPALTAWGCSAPPDPEPTSTPDIPPLASCGANVYSREAEAGIREDYFDYLSLFDWGTGESLSTAPDGTFHLTSDRHPAVGYQAAFPNHLRLCIQAADAQGEAVFDETINTEGQGTWTLPPLEAGRYVIRVIVKNMVIESLDLAVSQPAGPTAAGLPPLAQCGDNVYFREDQEISLENYFTSVDLVNADTGDKLPLDRNGNHLLDLGHYPGVSYAPAFPNHLRLCVQKFDAEGSVVYDHTLNTPDPGSWSLPPLGAGRYLIRVIVKNMVLESLVLLVQ